MMGIASQDKIAARFEAMLTACCLPASAIECIDDPKQRTIFRGVKAASEVPAVKNAFSIVYQDLGPVRVAGDLIFNQLKKSASLAAENVKDLDADQSLDALTAARTLFDVIDENASGRLDREEGGRGEREHWLFSGPPEKAPAFSLEGGLDGHSS